MYSWYITEKGEGQCCADPVYYEYSEHLSIGKTASECFWLIPTWESFELACT